MAYDFYSCSVFEIHWDNNREKVLFIQKKLGSLL